MTDEPTKAFLPLNPRKQLWESFFMVSPLVVIGTKEPDGSPDLATAAPFDGQVVFSGPFRGYGPIVILEHGGGYHSLIAGLHRIDTTDGSWVVAGEPVGVMSTGPRGERSLYLELRRNGQPINPLPWLASREGKTSG